MYNFFKALSGDKNAIAVDMHVYSIIMGKDPNKKQVNPSNKKEFEKAVTAKQKVAEKVVFKSQNPERWVKKTDN